MGGGDNYSKVSIEWLEWEAKRRSIKIQHALNGGEERIQKPDGSHYKVDGVYTDPHTDQKTVFEFNGCLHHGCLECYPEDLTHTHFGHSLKQRHALTMHKKTDLISLGYKYVGIWEHQYHDIMKINFHMKEYVNSLDITSRLDPRESFVGGRCNAVKLYATTTGNKKIKYVDFTSLYPAVNKYDKYPVGHPTVICSDFKDINQYFGLPKVKVTPPRKLYHPVLPCKLNGKLVFPLCQTCATMESREPCSCNDEARRLVGCWTTLELQKAIELGYAIEKMYEVYHWDETTQYNPKTEKGGLFLEYVNLFLRLKEMASGWPEKCESESAKQCYIDNYKQREGIQLDKHSIEKNPGLRSLAKLCLNR